jgi:DNA primase
LAAAEPEKPAVVSAEVKGLPEGYEPFGDASDEIEQAVRVYLESRSVSILQIVHHKIGYACVGPMAWRALFPVFGEDGNIYGCVGRAIRGDMKPKYLNTPGIKLLWNAEHLGQFAVVSEGIMDALKIEKVLLQYRNGVSVARLGSSITVHQIGQLKKYERVIIAPDWDVPGIKGAIGLMKRCVAAGITTSVIVPEVMNGYDPGSMAEQDLKIQIDEAIPFTEHVENRLRLAATRMRIPKGLFY